MIPQVSVKQFRDQEGWRKLLSEAFEGSQGVLHVAISALRQQSIILHDAPQKPGVHPDGATMHEYHRVKGWNQALKALEEMRNPLPEATEAEKAANRKHFEDYGEDDLLLKDAPPKPETYFQPKL